jgi:hypothetical protein
MGRSLGWRLRFSVSYIFVNTRNLLYYIQQVKGGKKGREGGEEGERGGEEEREGRGTFLTESSVTVIPTFAATGWPELVRVVIFNLQL